MARNKRGQNINGWIIIDKPKGITSSDVVIRVRKLLNANKAGHSGTLDPIATGVLPIAFGEATKTIQYAVKASKTYVFEVCWGEERDTDDIEGKVTQTSDLRPSEQMIKAALCQFVGEIIQVPPIYSAIKIRGQRAYNLARGQQHPTLEPRKIFIESFVFLRNLDQDHSSFMVTSGKGAYMRGLARDLAKSLGTFGHISALRRVSVGAFYEKNSISLDLLESLAHSRAALKHLLPLETALDGIPALTLSGDEANKLRQGQTIPFFRTPDRERLGLLREGDLLYATSCGVPIAISRIQGGCVCPVRVLNL